MNISEAIKIVISAPIYEDDAVGEALNVVVDASMKQEKMEVKMFSTDFGRCPACDSIVDRVDYYCRYCGQRLE